nr:L-2-amino-thiazoline-4-carboxylic acid hydrolase [Komagataeibacter sp. FNDCF1]
MPIIQQRRIEASILKHVYDVLVESHGQAMAAETIRRAVTRSAIEQGEAMRARFDHMPDLLDFADILKFWTADDALTIEVLDATPARLDFNVRRCRYAELYREMGLGEIGAILSCNRDGTFCEGFNPAIVFERTQTIMEGAEYCDFHYEIPADDKTNSGR